MITVLGDGAWGTAVALLLARNGHDVTLWCYNHEVANTILTTRKNQRYLPDFEVSKKITPTTSLSQALASEIIFEGIPVKYMRSVLQECTPYAREDQVWISLSKGMENNTLLFPTQIIQAVLKPVTKVAVVSGPSYAHDLAAGQPTGVTVAAENQLLQHTVADLMRNQQFCCELSNDLLGVQLMGTLKNSFALGVGVLHGAGYGANTQTLFVMRGLSETRSICKALGCDPAVINSFAGIGDTMLTAFGKLSRNYQVGAMLGSGKKLTNILEKTGYTPEGLNTLQSIHELAQTNNFQLPLCNALYKVVFNGEPVQLLTCCP